jgi:magnesium-protoporphyrin IX monomethyl ester (oxidative) cyclase
VKALAPGITICLGGANCDDPMGATLAGSFPQVDVVFAGESDVTFPDFVGKLLPQSAPPPLSRSRGAMLPVVGQANGSKVVGAEPIAAMDELPVPDLDDFFGELDAQPFRDRVRPALVFEASRGCWWGAKHHCTFCGLNANGMGYRA